MRPIGDILKRDRNIILKGADAATRGGFTQVPNFLLKSKKLSAGDQDDLRHAFELRMAK